METYKMLDFFPDPNGSDIRLEIESQKDKKKLVVPGHSQVLAEMSTAVASMMQAGTSREDSSSVLALKVQGDDNDALFFLRYLYTKSVDNLDLDACLSLIQTAEHYEVADLIEKCEQKIIDIVTPVDICRLYRSSDIFSEDLLSFCLDFLLKSAGFIFMSDLHVLLDEETMTFLLGSECLNVPDEVQVLEALWKWGQTKSFLEGSGTAEDTRKKIQDLLLLVRWPFVNDIDRDAPWYEAAVEFKAKHTEESMKRVGDAKLPLNSYARILRIPEKSVVLHDRFYILERGTLITFSLSKRVLVTGFLLRLDSTLASFSNMPFKVLVNGIDYTGLVSFEAVVRSKHTEQLRDARKEVYSRDFRVEFLRPVLLPKDGTLVIGIKATHDALYAPAYSVKDDAHDPDSDGQPKLNVQGNVIGLQYIFYFD